MKKQLLLVGLVAAITSLVSLTACHSDSHPLPYASTVPAPVATK